MDGDFAPSRSLLRFRSLYSLAKQVTAEFFRDRIPDVAAGVTFFALLALFPAIACIVSLYGLFGERALVMEQLYKYSVFLPGGAIDVLSSELRRLNAEEPTQLGLGFLVSFIIALWSASGGIKALVDGLNVAYEVQETRSFFRVTLLALVFTVIVVAFAITVITVTTVIPIAMEKVGVHEDAQAAFNFLAWPSSYLLCVLVLALIYRFGADRKHARWRWITWGSAIASALWIAGTVLFSWYVQNYGTYNRVYGPLGSMIGFLTWIWLSLVVMLAGAELNCELERNDKARQRARWRAKRAESEDYPVIISSP